jgi:hypothetical protein
VTAPAAPAHSASRAGARRLALPRVQLRPPTTATIVNVVVVLAATAFVFQQLHPELLFRNTTPAGGDMGAHVWGPAFMRDHLLPHGRLTGWTNDWYAGFPALVFYFPIPSLLIVLLDVVLPYAIAFKLITVLGLLTLPACAFAFGRLSGMRDPGPACLAAATLPFLFDRTFTIYGGNIPSTLAGEFAFSISLSLMLLFLGYFAKGLATGRHRALASVLLALTGLCHMIPAIFAVGGAGLLLLFRIDRHRLKWAIPVFFTGGALASFWAVPFLLRLPYTNDMGWEKITDFRTTLFPSSFMWVVALAFVGVLASLLLRRRTGLFLAALVLATGVAFAVAPQGRLWNARLLPFWFLWMWLLVGVMVAEIGSFLGTAVRRTTPAGDGRDNPDGTANANGDRNGSANGMTSGIATGRVDDPDRFDSRPPVALVNPEPLARFVELGTPIAFLLLALVLVGFPLRVLPFGSEDAKTGKYTWMGISSADRSFIPDWARWNYSGYEDKGKSRQAEYAALVKTMTDVGTSDGCGRAMWEYESEEDAFGTPMALMLLPHWTDGCIGSMEGLFFESSATTPYHFLNQSELSERPSRAMRDLPYSSLSVSRGAEHLQLLGVRYYMAISPAAQTQADNSPDLKLVAQSGPWTVHYTNGDQQRTWNIYEVQESELVTPLIDKPAVATNVAKGGKGWLGAAVSWYQNRTRWDVPIAVSGPKDWPRVTLPRTLLDGKDTSGLIGADFDTSGTPHEAILNPPKVSNIKVGDDRISFDVDKVGEPVLVKMSYFPNWKASGAGKVYRVTPNQMVVVPTSKHVSLHYGYTPVDGLGYLLTFIGIGCVFLLWRMGPVVYPDKPRHRRRRLLPPADEAGAAPDEDAYSTALERQLTGVGSGGAVDVDSYFD